MSRIFAPDLVWLPEGFRAGHQVEVLDEGTFGRIGPALGKVTDRLAGETMLPGMVNAHSHAFQRGLRGKAERFERGAGSFWSWREEMYRLVERTGTESFRRLSVSAFREMLAAGITSVGEFHYLHHLPGSSGYELDDEVLDAAKVAGIRLVLLDVCYLTGDVGVPLEGAQLRFGSTSIDAFVASCERLESVLDRRTQRLGVAAHSLRGVPIEQVGALHEWARHKGAVFHMHVEEQPKEIEAVRARYGKGPLELLRDRLELGPEFAAVHCTHSDAQAVESLRSSGANIVICPLTEANLADGLPPTAVTRKGLDLALGTDSNLRIDFTEEMRLLEYAQRLRSQRRGAFTDGQGRVADRLFRIATEGGARALGIEAGRIAPGYAADFFTVATDETGTPDERITAFVLGEDARAIRRVAVSGNWVAL